MEEVPDSAAASSSPEGIAVRGHRPRSVPSAWPFLVAVMFWSLHALGLVATGTALVCLIIQPSELALRLFIAGLVFSAVSWVVAYFKRRGAHCPLCRGTPLVCSGALPHARAWRIPPLNHGLCAVLSIMVTQRFRCMYCGSDYDLLKPSSRLHGHGVDGDGAIQSRRD